MIAYLAFRGLDIGSTIPQANPSDADRHSDGSKGIPLSVTPARLTKLPMVRRRHFSTGRPVFDSEDCLNLKRYKLNLEQRYLNNRFV